ncbi:response regulator [Paenibacillus pasadenensis]|uniref:response regulator transcription factor n=1 Tax=Paenibacillus pasadenensis TaxID=217090 RepID=UPI000415CC79|nr:response regulator transcription factor [Paenibacillus pasadenensis]
MYKLILADDEPIVREGLMNTIDWASHGFELAGDYANGRDALEAVERIRPDLVLTDINMPFMDGLELSARISASHPAVKIIILTGYDQFEYAQQALRMKVYDFILKPITASETRELLDRLRAELDEEKRRKEDVDRLRSQLTQSLPLLRERYLDRLAATGAGSQDAEERLAYFGLPPLQPPLVALLLDYDGGPAAGTEPDRELLRFAGYNIAEEIAVREGAICFRTREERIAVLLSGKPPAELYEQASRIAWSIRREIEHYLGYAVSAAFGRAADRLEELPEAYRSALAALDYRFHYGRDRVLSIVELEGASAPPAASEDWSGSLGAALRTGSPAELRQLFGDFAERLKQSRAPFVSCQLEIQRALVTMLSVLQEMGVDESGLGDSPGSLFAEAHRLPTLDEVGEWLTELAVRGAKAAADGRSRLGRSQIGQALLYIEQNFADERLSLSDISRQALMSTSYFSQMFKQETGETFVEYLTRIRMAKAKELLENTPLKLYEIAARVGYSDPNYFSLAFKKHAGLSPREYREQARGQA